MLSSLDCSEMANRVRRHLQSNQSQQLMHHIIIEIPHDPNRATNKHKGDENRK